MTPKYLKARFVNMVLQSLSEPATTEVEISLGDSTGWLLRRFFFDDCLPI